MITMLLGGMWHGAGWTFIIWGALHGFYLIAHRV
jgi:D-alanyl-lipoteichoic acid acyltransferase DltB (MBOAT superfamily)